jgi:hypothetical protein
MPPPCALPPPHMFQMRLENNAVGIASVPCGPSSCTYNPPSSHKSRITMSSAPAAASPRLGPMAAGDQEPSFAVGGSFGAFGKSTSFKSPINIQIMSFTREEGGFVNYDIMVILFQGLGCVLHFCPTKEW